jgi:hypothetical protein
MGHLQRRVRSALPLALVLALTAAPAASAARVAPRQAPGRWCGGALWRQMVLSDSDAGKVDLQPATTTIAAIAKLTPPHRIWTERTTPFQRQAWHVHAVIDRYRIASNGEIALVLFSIESGTYMNAYLPNPRCLSAKTRARASIVAARQELTRRCPAATTAWQLLGISTEVTGIGFWNRVRTSRGALPNGAELRPVIDLKIDSGCGVS